MTTLTTSPRPAVDRALVALERARIDNSVRVPVLFFFGSALFWLLSGTVLALTASIKLHSPGFLGGQDWLTFGRVRPSVRQEWGNHADPIPTELVAQLRKSDQRKQPRTFEELKAAPPPK